MIEACRAHFALFNKDYIREIDGQFDIVEKAAGGAGKITFSVEGPCVILNTHPQAPLLWALNNRKCADGAFLTFNDGNAHLHIIELKSKLASAEWSHATKQFEGMFLTALAACRLMEITSITSVTCYIAFTSDQMNAQASSSPALIKTMVGKTNPLNAQQAWEDEQVTLPYKWVAPVRKIQRDPATKNGSFALSA